MTTPRQKRLVKKKDTPDLITFALTLAATDFSTFRRWQWDQLRDDLARALGYESEGVVGARVGVLVASAFRGARPHKLGRRTLEELQRDVAALLRVVSGQHRTPPIKAIRGFRLPSLEVALLPKGDRSLLYVRGTVRDTFIYVVQLALTQTTNRVVRQCVECQRLFRAAGKRSYCSRQCSNRRNNRNWKSNHSPEEIRAAGRERYERSVAPAKPRRYRARQTNKT